MTWKKGLGISTALAGATVLTTILVHAQQPAKPRVPPPAVPAVRDAGKYVIEGPTKALLAGTAGVDNDGRAMPKEGSIFVNPKVAPGKVRWHKDFASACAAAARSGKPVLLFHMMGRLDDKFC
jgi:hypothetical protein